MADRARFRVVHDIWDPAEAANAAMAEAMADIAQRHQQDVAEPAPAPRASVPVDRGEVARLRDAVERGDRSAAEVLRDLLRRARRG
jgi:hypothetical protein